MTEQLTHIRIQLRKYLSSPVTQRQRICLQSSSCRSCGFNPWARDDPLEEVIATHSSILAWKSPRTEEPVGLQFEGLQRVGHD